MLVSGAVAFYGYRLTKSDRVHTLRERELENHAHVQVAEIQAESRLIDQLMADMARLREELQTCVTECAKRDIAVADAQHSIDELTKELDRLKTRRLGFDSAKVLETLINIIPWPCWIREVNTNTWHVNKTFADWLGVKHDGFWSSLNLYDFCNRELIDMLTEGDEAVIASGMGRTFREKIPVDLKVVDLEQTNEYRDMLVHRHPIKIEVNSRLYIFSAMMEATKDARLLDFLKLTESANGC